ncbi:MAG: FeoB-associated Cys-rich membrane protein [Bacillota bacterium]|nr:FeoB-associated Cys-rich membrane protein [Bacillota bacterium]
MLVNIVIGIAIFGYASFALVKFIKKSKKGKCAACDLQKSCKSECRFPPTK